MSVAGRQRSTPGPHALWIARAMARSDLSPLAPEDIPRLEAICTPRSVAGGTLLLSAGADAERIYVVRRGEVQLAVRKPLGRQTVALVRTGGVIGDIPMLCGKPMPFDAVATRDSAVLELEQRRLVGLLRTSPTLSLRWTTSVAKRMEENQQRILALLTMDLAGQVATILLDEREAPSAGGEPVVRLSHAVIAQLLGARRQSVSRVMRDMRRRRLVEGGYRHVALLDLEGLAALAGRDDVSPPCGQGAPSRPAPSLPS